jgi:hypothetical protein
MTDLPVKPGDEIVAITYDRGLTSYHFAKVDRVTKTAIYVRGHRYRRDGEPFGRHEPHIQVATEAHRQAAADAEQRLLLARKFRALAPERLSLDQLTQIMDVVEVQS